MDTSKRSSPARPSQWGDVKVSGGSSQELTKVVAQVRAQVRDERKIFSSQTLSASNKNKSQA